MTASTAGSTAAVPMVLDPVIARLDEARRMLSEAATITQAKDVHAVASAAEVYARRQQLGEETIGFAHAVKLDALRLLGELLRQTPKASGGEHGGRAKLDGTRVEPSNPTPTLEDLGLDKKTSSVAQRLADMPGELFDAVRARKCSVSFAVQQVKREVALAKGPKIEEKPAFHVQRAPIVVHGDDPIVDPIQMDWRRVLADFHDRDWSESRIANSLVITASTVQRWATCTDITFGLAYALLVLHQHVCGGDLTMQRIREASRRHDDS